MAYQMKHPAGRPGADTAEHSDANYTPSNAEALNARLLSVLTRRVWLLTYTLEESRQRCADRRQFLREACVCVALALLRLAGVRYV